MAQHSMVGIFNDLARNRQHARITRMQFVVVFLKKDGTPRKVTSHDLQWNATVTQEQAETHKAHLEQLNPGLTGIILCL